MWNQFIDVSIFLQDTTEWNYQFSAVVKVCVNSFYSYTCNGYEILPYGHLGLCKFLFFGSESVLAHDVVMCMVVGFFKIEERLE